MLVIERPLLVRGSVRVLEDGMTWEWAGRRRRPEDADAEAHVDDLIGVPAKDLGAALRRFAHLMGAVDVRVFTDGSAEDDLEYASYSPVSFTLVEGTLAMVLDVYGDDVPEDEQPAGAAAERIAPLLTRKRMWLIETEEELESSGRFWRTRLTLGFHVRGRSAAALVMDGLEICELVTAAAGGGLTRATCGDLIRAGHAAALLGQPEGDWLEVKREHYPLKELVAKIRIAQTVAQFANAADGGLVVIGMATKKMDGTDTIHAITAQPSDPTVRRRYVQVLQQHLYPPPEDLQIEVVPADGINGRGDLVIIDIPPQPEELKPFLVHGAIVDGRAFGNYISVVRRRDDEMVSTTAAALHSTLAAGRALLRRGVLE